MFEKRHCTTAVSTLMPKIFALFLIRKWICLIQSKSECSIAQLRLSLFILFSCCSRYVAFVELIHLNDLNDNETFIFLTNQWRRHRHTTHTQHTHNNLLLVGHTLRAGACKNTNKVPFKILNRNCSQIEFDTLIP